MASLLDSMLDNYAPASTRVVSERHDPNTINFVAGLSDPGEMIRCGYLPEIRRQEGEQDAEYAERIRPIIMALPKDQRDKIMNAAVQRASLDRTNGKVAVVVAGELAWAGRQRQRTDDLGGGVPPQFHRLGGGQAAPPLRVRGLLQARQRRVRPGSP